MKKIFPLLFLAVLLSSCTLFPDKDTQSNIDLNSNVTTSVGPSPTTNPSISPMSNSNIVSLTTKNGQIVIKLYDKETPGTYANFMSKVTSGFYDNLTFHRVIPGFMAQGGDPLGTGTGGGKQKSELNNIPFKRGSLGLARTAETKEVSNDSQFFICFTDDGCAHLTSDYVNFGEVISGLDVLDKITQGDKIISITDKTK